MWPLPACGGGDAGAPTSDVAGTVPWGDTERHTYVIRNDDGEELGQGVLSIQRAGATTTLTQEYKSKVATDSISVVVDSQTLKPVSGSRRIVNPGGEDVLEVTYTPEGALIRHNDEKQSGLSVPEHSYDNDSSLFLWRTLPFAPGYEASYTTIITGRRSRQKVNLEVTGKETVRVPAGQFEAWRLEIRTSNARQVAWFADTPQRTLLRYDNDRDQIFELTSTP
ncbi:MAG TPA: DUF3108 domain-containing protein [Dehalococcoidia bacterium]|nr:DUF3108 domain-containing protein [Dehalococcoidia bacterium]